MNRRAALKFALAFCAALFVGRLLFYQGAPKPMPSQAEPAGYDAAVLTAAIPQQVTSPEIEQARATSRLLAARGIDRELKAVDGGVENDNTRMGHFMASDVAEGTLHKAKNQFGASVRWLPQQQEFRRKHDVTAVLGQISSAVARIEKRDNGTRCVYPGSYPNVDEHMYVRADGGVEHDYLLKQPPQALDETQDLAFTGYLQLSPGLTLWDGKTQITGSYTAKDDVHIKNTFGNTVMVMHRPKAYDASVTLPDGGMDVEKQAEQQYRFCFTGCQYQFDFDDSGIKLAIVTPGKWLKDAGRTYPVTIDPPYGPFGLADGDPPAYVGAVGNDTLIPAYAGGTMLGMIAHAGDDPNICQPKLDNGYGILGMPFPFTYYGALHPTGSALFVHIDGFASWLCPWETCRPLVPPSWSACFDTDNQPLPHGGYPFNAFFPYWDDLKFGPGPSGADPGSGIFYFTDGVAPDRRLVIEWRQMQYVRSPNPKDMISFNLVLYECGSKIQVIIGQSDEVDLGAASVGIQDGGLGIQYTYNSKQAGYPPITPGTSVSFQPASTAGIRITPDAASGCIPLEVCFNAILNSPPTNCGTGPSIPPSFAVHWIFGDGSEAFTEKVCHTWVEPGNYQVLFKVTDEFGATTTEPPILVQVCDKPLVVIGANPQGGPAPLIVDLEARTPANTNLTLTGQATWQIDKLGLNNEPGQFVSVLPPGGLTGNILQFRFDDPGTYRVTGTFDGMDITTGLSTFGVGTVFIFVTDPGRTIEDNIIITEAKFKIDWKSKVPPKNAAGITPAPQPLNPNNDTLYLKGIISLPGITPSALAGRRARVVVNGVLPVFDGILDANGTATQGDQTTGQTGFFSIRQPSGNFFCSVKNNLFGALGLVNMTERRLAAVQFRIEIEGLFPGPSLGPLLTFDYQSKAYNSATGVYKFGKFTKDGPARGGVFSNTSGLPIGSGKPGGLETLSSGGFLVTKATVKLQGKTVFADLQGLLARSGGDSLRPKSDSDVIVTLGGFTEALNFTTTPKFKTSGKAPAQKFTFKRSGGLGSAGIANLQWQDQAGTFRIKTFGLPNELVGIDPTLAIQALTLGLTITPESTAVFQATTRFEIDKKSDTEFLHSGK